MTIQPDQATCPIAVLLSGTGRTLANLLQQIETGDLPVDVRGVISSHAGVKGLQIAQNAGIEQRVLLPGDYDDVADYSTSVFELCRDWGVQLVVMAGFIRYVEIPPDFEHRVVNIHPALIPAFCGQGYYGRRVHQAALDYGVKLSGCTVHFVDNEYDHGPIVMQQAVPVLEGDTAESLAARVFAAECEIYPAAIRAIAQGRVAVRGRWVEVSPEMK